MPKTINNDKSGLTFKQGLQLFFVRKILDDRYTMGWLVGTERGNEFFRQWSGIVCEGRKKDKDFQCTVKVPEDYYEQFSEAQLDRSEESLEEVSEKMKRRAALEKPSFAPSEYHPILQNPRFSAILHLLGDEDLGELMRIPYAAEAEAAEIAAVVGTSKDEDIIHGVIARHRGKKPDELSEDDYSNIKKLDLRDSGISNLEPIKKLCNLEVLILWNTRVSELEPIKELSHLQGLDLSSTKVRNLDPIKGLRSLQSLVLWYTQVSDLEPIKGLINLKSLDLRGTKVSDLEPIKELSSLQVLDLRNTQVSNLEPINGLISLQVLYLEGTQVSDLEPIKGLSSLQRLNLNGTQVNDLEPIKGLRSLQWLYLDGTQVSDLEPIKELGTLKVLALMGTQVADEQVEELQKAMPKVQIVQ